MVDLSVVLIGKNQEWNIKRLIESVLNRIPQHLSSEVIYVDSASTDRTIELASQYPITIIQLSNDQRLTAAAGRNTGYRHSSGRYLLFLDGDMELWEGWIEKALDIFTKRPEVGGLTGIVIDKPVDTQPHQITDYQPSAYGTETETILQTGGAALFPRAVLEQVGSYHPFIYSDEEPELCLRIRHAGYVLLRIKHPISYHYSSPSDAISTLFARRKRNLYLGLGQNMRFHLGDSLLWPYIKERGFAFVPAIAIVMGLIALLLSLATNNGIWLVGFVGLLVGIVLLDAIRKRSLYKAWYSFVHRWIIFEGTIKGFLMTPQPPEAYPYRLQIIKQTSPTK